MPDEHSVQSVSGLTDSHAVILEKLHTIAANVEEIKAIAKATNGRVNKHETAIAVLRWVVFSGGVGILGALVYLIKMHMVS